jgi:hypothetical protein
MKHGRKPRRHALAAPSSDPKSYQLRAASSFNSGLKVDREAGIIRGVALMSVGPAKGYGFEVDRTTLQQTFSLASGKPGGVKIRLGHPGNDTQAVLSAVGRVKNAHLDGDVLRGDVHLGTYAKSMPNGGNAWDYLLARAEEAPEDFGLSAVVHLEFDKSPTTGGLPIARARQLDAIDFVDNPAANHAGLLSAPPETVDPATKPTPVVPGIDPNPSLKGASSMDEVLKAYLLSLGLNPQATVEQAKTFFVSLSTERQNAAPSQDKIPADWKPAPVTLATKVEPTFVELETKRVKDITSLCALYPGLPTDFVQKQIALNVDLEKVKTNALAAIATANPNPGGGRPGSILVGDDQAIAAHRQAMSDAILIRAGRKVEKPHELATKLAGRKVLEMGRRYMMALGVDEANDLSDTKLWEMLVRPQNHSVRYAALAQSSDSFANITLDAANKTLRQEYQLAPSTWQIWARRGLAPDFKNINRVALSDVPGLVAKAQGGEIKYNVLSDNKESYVVATYANGIRLTREAVINDDLSAFDRIPRAQAMTAKQLEDDVVYAILTANAALSDTGALFNGTAVTTAGGHANYDSATASVGAPNVTTLGLGRKSIRTKTGPKGNKLNLSAKYLIVPAALETAADQYTSANYVAAVQTSINPFAQNGRTPLVPVVEPRLDDTSATVWYLAADNARIDTVEASFLMDEPEPVLKQEIEFDTDDIKFAVRHTVGAKAIDYRGLYKNAGA